MGNWWRLAGGARVMAPGINLALAVAACGSSSSGNSTPAASTASFVSGACPTGVAGLSARCGYLVVPENRNNENGLKIRLPVAIIPSVPSWSLGSAVPANWNELKTYGTLFDATGEGPSTT